MVDTIYFSSNLGAPITTSNLMMIILSYTQSLIRSIYLHCYQMNDESENKPPAEWTSKYWQWILSIPREENPLKTGNINDDEFISLPCTGGGEDCGRKLNLSYGDVEKDILIPVFTAEYCTGEVLNGSDEQLLQKAREESTPIHMEVSVDGHPLMPYYIETEPFQVTVPDNHALENESALAGTYRAVACGYWHKLKPLSSGKHIIKFGGAKNGFYTKVLYEINVPDNKA